MLSLEKAQESILDAIPRAPAETVQPSAALGRFLAQAIRAPIDLPCFDNSAMDGYAVRSGDLAKATADNPIALKVLGASPAGEVMEQTVPAGKCVRLFTGSVLPPGADAVVMQEDTRLAPERAGEVLFFENVKPWENVRFRGEDIKKGSQIFSEGERVTIGGVGLLAALGLREIRVGAQPALGVLSTGSELLEAEQPIAPGKIYESNRVMLSSLLEKAGAKPKVFPLVPDNLLGTQIALEKAFEQYDGVITTGGVSVGEHDYVKDAFECLGGVMEFWKVDIRPGKPFVFGRWREKVLFGLPGNPVSAFVTFLLLVRPALLRWQGAANVGLPAQQGVLKEPLVNRGERRHFMRVTLDEEGHVRSAGIQSSHVLGSLAKANGLVNVPPQTTLQAGSAVQVLRWE